MIERLKVITLWQPYASLMAIGLKGNETRSWAINHRGELGIHAAKRLVPFEDLFPEMSDKEKTALMEILCEKYGSYDKLPKGQIIARANLFDCQEIVPIEEAKKKEILRDCGPAAQLQNGKIIYGPEYHFGDYTPGRFAWLTKDVEEIEPVTINGQQGLWTWKK